MQCLRSVNKSGLTDEHSLEPQMPRRVYRERAASGQLSCFPAWHSRWHSRIDYSSVIGHPFCLEESDLICPPETKARRRRIKGLIPRNSPLLGVWSRIRKRIPLCGTLTPVTPVFAVFVVHLSPERAIIPRHFILWRTSQQCFASVSRCPSRDIPPMALSVT